nr:MAG: ORF1 [TTV-like mini virus]
MPYGWWRNQRYWKRRRYWARRRRIRAAIRRRHRRRRWLVRKSIFPLYKTFKVKQWNPRITKLCKIKGQIPLFICGKDRQMFNFIQYKDSIVPVGQSGGGGWSIMVFNLGGLFTEFEKLNNWWTASNDGLPLCKYLGCKFHFYQSWDTDYVVNYQTCPPMTDTELKHLDAQPSRMLMNKKAIIVPNLIRNEFRRKKYITKKFPPPALLKNQWYFQQDLCNQNLLLLTTSATSLDQYYIPNNEVSYNITLISLNTSIFQQPNFANLPETSGYQPKTTMYLWGGGNGDHETPTNVKQLIYLGNTIQFQKGEYNQTELQSTRNKWGNPFYHDHSTDDTAVYYSTKWPTTNTESIPLTKIDSIFTTCRYNPLKDTGDGNEVYFKSNSIATKSISDPPNNPDVYIHGYPLWLIFWGWTDWIEKLKPIQQIYLNYYVVVKSKFITPAKPAYVFLDDYFTTPDPHHLNETDKANWHPRFEYQKKSLNSIAVSGPGAPKTNKSQSIQAKAFYTFYFKWGGCPAPMLNIKDPCEQAKFPNPNNQLQRLQATDPKTDIRTMLHDCDERRQSITKTAIKRLKSFAKIPPTILTGETNFDIQPHQETASEATTSEEEEEERPFKQQLIHIRHQYKKLKRKLNRINQYPL